MMTGDYGVGWIEDVLRDWLGAVGWASVGVVAWSKRCAEDCGLIDQKEDQEQGDERPFVFSS
jgi:hypothetical protein